jgi:hypothetical protein
VGSPLSFTQTPQLRASDFQNGLATQDDVKNLFAQLQPMVMAGQTAATQAITRESQTFTVVLPNTDWQAIANSLLTNSWAVGPGPALTCQDGQTPGVVALAYRVDMSGNVWLRGNLTGAAAGGATQVLAPTTTTAGLPTFIVPEIAHVFCILGKQAALTAAASLTVGSDGSINIQVLPAIAATTYQFLVSWPTPLRVPGCMLAIRGANNSIGQGFPITVQFQNLNKPASIRLSLVELQQTPGQLSQTTSWQLGVQVPHVATGVCWSWQGQGQVIIDAIPGLALQGTYQVTVEAFY